MTLVKTASVRMPVSGLNGIVRGGKYWVSEDFTVSVPATWEGIVLDSTGLIVGATNAGISVWKAGKKSIIINSGGLCAYNSAGNPTVYINYAGSIIIAPSSITTSGILIDPDNVEGGGKGITIWKSAVKRMQLYEDGMNVWNASSVATFQINSAGSVIIAPTAYSGSGIMIDPDNSLSQGKGITVWKSGVKRMQIYEDGINVWNASSVATFQINSAGSVIIAPSSKTTSGVLIDPDDTLGGGKGITIWKSGVRRMQLYEDGINIWNAAGTATFQVNSAGSVIIAPTAYAGTGIMIDPDDTLGYGAGITIWQSAAKKVQIDSTGISITALTGGSIPLYCKTTDYAASTTGSAFAIGFGAATGQTYTWLAAMKTGGSAWSNLIMQSGGGYVGIGVTDPAAVLTINTSSSPGWDIFLGTASVSGRGIGRIYAHNSIGAAFMANIYWDSGSSTSKRVVTGGGGYIYIDTSTGSTAGHIYFSNFVSGSANSSPAEPSPLIIRGDNGAICMNTTEYAATLNVNQFSGASAASVFGNTNYSVSGKTGSALAVGFGAATGSTNSYLAALQYPGGGAAVGYADLVLYATTVKVGTSGTSSPLWAFGTIFAESYTGSKTLAGTGNRAVYSDATGWLTNTSSDASLKTAVEALPYGLDAVLAMRPVRFEWLQPAILGDQKEIGFIAQEIEAIIPEVVGINYDGMKSLDYPKLTAVLCRAIQELSAQVEALKT